MRVGVDVGIDANGDRGLDAELAGDVVEARQLGLALDVESKNPLFQRETDLALGFANAGEHATAHVGPGSEHASNLAAAHKVECRTEAREMAEHGEAGIGLHREANLRVEASNPACETGIVVRHGGGGIDVGGRAVEPRDLGEVHGLTV